MTQQLPPQTLRRLLVEAADQIPPSAGNIAEARQRSNSRRRGRMVSLAAINSAAVVAVLAIATVAVHQSGYDPGESAIGDWSTTEDSSDPGMEKFQIPALELAGNLEEVGKADPEFTNVALDIPNRAVVVYRKSGQPDKLYRRVYDQRTADQRQVLLEFRRAMLTADETTRTVNSLIRARPELRRAGITVHSISPSSWGGPVTIGVDQVTQQAISIAQRHAPYGPDTVSVARDEPSQLHAK